MSRFISRRDVLWKIPVVAAGLLLTRSNLPQRPEMTRSADQIIKYTSLPAVIEEEIFSSESSASSTPESIPSPEPLRLQTVYDRLIEPFVSDAIARRHTRYANDTGYRNRVDWQLNDNRINFLLFAYGETYEPPNPNVAIIGSYTIASYNYSTRKIDFVSLTHDIRTPEIERFRRAQGFEQRYAMKIHSAYEEGGVLLMNQVIESATGLAVDYTMVLPDSEIVSLIDGVTGRVKVEIPRSFWAHKMVYDGKFFPEREFKRGVEDLDGKGVLHFIKSVPIETAATYDRSLEHNARKHLVAKGLLESLKSNAVNPWLWWNLAKYISEQGGQGKIEYEPDIKPLVLSNLGNFAGSAIFHSGDRSGMPEIGKTIYIHDPKSGAGGVRWVAQDTNPITARDRVLGIYQDPNMAIPNGGNPYAEDLVKGYWGFLRSTVRGLLRG